MEYRYLIVILPSKYIIMEKIVLATHNRHKCEEFRDMLKGMYDIISLYDIGLNDEIPETGTTFHENARQKAEFVRNWLLAKNGETLDVMADDSGLEVMALNGEPGVFSARYAGEGCSSQDCINKLLRELKGVDDRRARFVTVIAKMNDKGVEYFEGEVKGKIIDEMRGEGGFGYDPVFVPEGESKTFAELGNEIKNTMSHRANAIKEMLK